MPAFGDLLVRQLTGNDLKLPDILCSVQDNLDFPPQDLSSMWWAPGSILADDMLIYNPFLLLTFSFFRCPLLHSLNGCCLCFPYWFGHAKVCIQLTFCMTGIDRISHWQNASLCLWCLPLRDRHGFSPLLLQLPVQCSCNRAFTRRISMQLPCPIFPHSLTPTPWLFQGFFFFLSGSWISE